MMKSKWWIMLILLMGLVLLVVSTGCSTRQVLPGMNGSTAQRLVTHSIDHLMQGIPQEDFSSLENKRIHVRPHFIIDSPIYTYATERFKLELSQRFSCRIVPDSEAAEYRVDLFFTSLATEHDTFGFHIPFLVMPGFSGASNVNLLAVEMFHGVSEMYYYVSNGEGDVLLRRDKTRSTVRTDKLALPVTTIPINTMD